MTISQKSSVELYLEPIYIQINLNEDINKQTDITLNQESTMKYLNSILAVLLLTVVSKDIMAQSFTNVLQAVDRQEVSSNIDLLLNSEPKSLCIKPQDDGILKQSQCRIVGKGVGGGYTACSGLCYSN